MPDSDAVPHLAPRRILIRGVNWLGDAVMTTPSLLRLRERFPTAHIALLTRDSVADLWLEHPAVNETISFSRGEGITTTAGRLRAGNFDLALVLPNSPRSALEVWAARIPNRIGYARPWRNWLLTRAVASRPGVVKMHKRSPAEIRQLVSGASPRPIAPLPASAHQIHEYLHLVAALGASPEPLAPQLRVPESALDAVRSKFQLDPAVTWLGLTPGAEYGPAKRWPVERFAAAAGQIQRQTKCGWVILGAAGDAALAGEAESSLRTMPRDGSDKNANNHLIRNLAGRTSLRELMAALKICRVLLTNDSGPMHIASALGTPVVAPFGSTSPELTGPGLPGDSRHRVLRSGAACAPCFLRECPIDFRCMTGIAVESVVDAIGEALKKE